MQQAIIYKESNIAVYIFMQVVYNNLNKVGPKTVPCGTPESTDNLEDVIPFKRTCCCLFSKKSLIP